MLPLKACLLACTLLLAACASPPAPAAPTPFTPPTVSISPTPAVTPTPVQALPSPTPACTAGLLFVQDLTIPDGSMVSPGEQLDKRWLVQNSGTCNWDERYTFILIAGDALGAESPLPLYPAVSGSEAELRILFTAPDEAGTYRSAWQAVDPAGQPFGDPVFIEVVVP